METEGEPPCLLRAAAEVGRAGAMLSEGRVGRGIMATASWAKGEKAAASAILNEGSASRHLSQSGTGDDVKLSSLLSTQRGVPGHSCHLC